MTTFLKFNSHGSRPLEYNSKEANQFEERGFKTVLKHVVTSLLSTLRTTASFILLTKVLTRMSSEVEAPNALDSQL